MQNVIKRKFKKTIPYGINLILGNKYLRRYAANRADKFIYKCVVEKDKFYTQNIKYERYRMLSNLVNTVEKALTHKHISAAVRRKVLNVFVGRVMLESDRIRQKQFVQEFEQDPPGFITISPGKKCNLHCIGCYAGSGAKDYEKLDFQTVDRIVSEKTKLWNSFFTVISGGEPTMWRSEGKGIIDLCRAHPDNYFMIYTNGTLLDKDLVKKMAEVGNITPAISVEGFKEETDKRRGIGVYDKILKAMANLREAGVPFGVSVTATRENAEKIISDEFVDFYFGEQGAVYGWIFQYMPIGRHQSLDLMITPEQRKWMFKQEKHIVHDKHIFFADFWNGGIFSHGCLAAGRTGGYIYIEWNGNVTPCVFYPYSKVNIKDIYANGGNLNDTLKSDLMVGIRKWQSDYGYKKTGKDVHNLIAPCGIRDHYEFTRKHLEETNPKPIDEDAAEALKDPLYYKGLVDYDNKFQSLTKDIWQKDFIGNGTAKSGDDHKGEKTYKPNKSEIIKPDSLTKKSATAKADIINK